MTMVASSDDHDFKLGMLINGTALVEQVDFETSKISNDQFEVYLKNNQVDLVIDKRDPNIKRMYSDINTAYDKVFS